MTLNLKLVLNSLSEIPPSITLNHQNISLNDIRNAYIYIDILVINFAVIVRLHALYSEQVVTKPLPMIEVI